MKGLLGNLVAGMKDNKGFFQGGSEGVIGGRAKDFIMNLFGKDLMSRTKSLTSKFDPSNAKQVLRLQKMMNALGVTDDEGNELSEDSMLGRKTLSAIRSIQNQETEATGPDIESFDPSIQEDVDYGVSEELGVNDAPGPIDPWANIKGTSTLMRNAPGNSPSSWIDKLFGGDTSVLQGRDKY